MINVSLNYNESRKENHAKNFQERKLGFVKTPAVNVGRKKAFY